MRRNSSRRLAVAASALAAAGWSAFAGAPAAHADFQITVFNMGQQTYEGNAWDVFVLAATNTGTNNTGSTLAAADVIIDTGGPSTFTSQTGALGIDIESVGGTGSNAKYSANVNGSILLPFGQNAANNESPAAPEFGDVVGGTFIGIGTGTFITDLVNNAQTTQDGATSTGAGNLGGTAAVYVNGQTSDYLASGNVASSFIVDFANPPKSPLLDQGFENGIQSTNASNLATVNVDANSNALLNGTVHSLEVDVISKDNRGDVVYVPDDITDNGTVPFGQGGNVPFANIVIPASQFYFTVHGQLTGEFGGSKSFSVVAVREPPPPLPFSLSSTANNGLNVGTVTIVGTNGNYTSGTASPTGAQPTTGNLTIQNGARGDFTIAANHDQIIGFDEIGATSRAQLESDLASGLQATNPFATVADASNPILLANGDNVQIDFPGGPSVPGVNPEFFNYDFSSYTGNGTVTISQITVLPEPAATAAFALGAAFLTRRRRKTLTQRE